MGGSVGGNILRAATATVTGGFSELAREKPFQPGGSNKPKDLLAQSALGVAGGGAAAGEKGLSPKPPPVDTSAIDAAQKAQDAANAVQTADAEARRARSAKRQSSVLGSFQPGQATNAATLQPAQPRRSVLG